MGLFDGLLGNATEVNLDSIREEFGSILADGEVLESAFMIIRDKWVFTNKRLIMLNVQGVTGKKREYHSIPYRSITQFSIESAGRFDMDCEMKIWVSSIAEPYCREFGRNVDVKGIQRALVNHLFASK